MTCYDSLVALYPGPPLVFEPGIGHEAASNLSHIGAGGHNSRVCSASVEWRWLIGDFTDSAAELSADQRRHVSRIAHERHVSGRALARYTLLYLSLPTVLGFTLLPRALERLGIAGRIPSLIATSLIAVAVVWPCSAWLYGCLYVRASRRAMCDLGIPVCINCGYSHEGLGKDVPNCPECGGHRRH